MPDILVDDGVLKRRSSAMDVKDQPSDKDRLEAVVFVVLQAVALTLISASGFAAAPPAPEVRQSPEAFETSRAVFMPGRGKAR